MTIDMEKYTEFLNKFGDLSQEYIDRDSFQMLKEVYKDKINSKRVLETINDVRTLLKILEKRGIIQYNEISELNRIAKEFVKEESIEELISVYVHWLEENSAKINNLYSSGKSLNLRNNRKSNVPEYHFCENILFKELKDQSEENLLLNESCTNINSSHLEEKIVSIINVKSSKNLKRRYIVFIALFLLLLIILFSILMKVFYQSTAIVPITSQTTQQPVEEPESIMPYYISNVNVGVSTESQFTMNHTQYYSSTPMPSINRERELQNLIISKIGKKIGTSWMDVCRHLDLEESYIRGIEVKYFNEPQSFEKMFKEALNLYFSEPHNNWKLELMRALDLSRRRTLKEMLENILSDHNSL